MRSIRLICLVVCLAPGLLTVEAAEIPANQGWVTDLGGFLTPQQEQALETLMESYKQGSDNELALLTVPDLGGQPIERFALEVGRAWGMGEKDRNNAALLVVARQERKIRIEVARGLEGNLTDSISGRIIRDVIAPKLRAGDVYGGLRDGIEAMHAAAGGDYAALPERRGKKGSGLAGLIGPIFFIIFILSVLRGRGGGRGGVLPWLIAGSALSRGPRSSGWHSSGGGGGFGGFGGGGGFSGGGASGGW